MKSRLAISDRIRDLGAGIYFLLLSIGMTYPMIKRMSDTVIGGIGDNYYFIWLIRWYQKALFELRIWPFFNPWLNYPEGWNMSTTDTSIASTFFSLPFSNPVLGFNVGMLSTYLLSGLIVYAWVSQWTRNRTAGLIAGSIYAMLPYHQAHFLAGHLNQSAIQWVPLYFWGFGSLFRSTPGKTWKAYLLGGLGLLMLGLTSMYFLYNTLLLSAVFVLAYFLWGPQQNTQSSGFRAQLRARLTDRALWRRLVGFGLLLLPLIAFSALPFFNLNQQGGLASRSTSYASMYSASPTDFLLPSPDHFLWGQWINTHFDRSLWMEATLYVGVVSLVLGALAWVRLRDPRHPETTGWGSVLIPLACVGLAAFILALGTDFHWLSQRVEVPLPAFLAERLARTSVPIPMPGMLLFKYAPFYAKMRALMRVGIYALMVTSVLAGLGADWLLRRAAARRPLWAAPVLAVFLLAFVWLDFYPGPYTQLTQVQGRAVDTWLAQQPGQGAVIQFPFYQNEDQEQIYFTLIHQKPFVGGFFSANQSAQYLKIKPVLEKFPSAEGVALLRELKVQYVLVDSRQYPNIAEVSQQMEALGLTPVTTLDGQLIFELK